MLSCQCFQVSQEFVKMINNPCRFLCPPKTSHCAIKIIMFYRQMSKLKGRHIKGNISVHQWCLCMGSHIPVVNPNKNLHLYLGVYTVAL